MVAVDEHLERIRTEGSTIVRDVFDPDTATALVTRLDELERELGVTPADNGIENRSTVRI